MQTFNSLPGKNPLRLGVVYNRDFQDKLDVPDNSEKPPSYEANSEIEHIAIEIADILRGYGHDVWLLSVDTDPYETLRNLSDLKVDAVFNLVESIGEDPWREAEFAELLENLSIPYTGNSPTPLRISLAKDNVQKLLAAHRIPTAGGKSIWEIRDLNRPQVEKWTYPLFVKPARADGSIGIDECSIVATPEELRIRAKYLLDNIEGPVQVEKYLPGREFNVAIFPDPISGFQVVTEIDFTSCPGSFSQIVTYRCKWIEDSPEYAAFSRPVANDVAPGLMCRIIRIARAAFLAVGGNGYGRVDIRLDARGQPHVIDVNPNPCLDRSAGLAIAASSIAIDYPLLVSMILNHASVKEKHVYAPHHTVRPRCIGGFTAAN